MKRVRRPVRHRGPIAKFSATWILGLIALGLSSGFAATEAAIPPAAGREIDFAADVQPLLAARCTGCHGAQQQMSGLRLDRKEAAMRGGYSGAVILAGNSAASKMIRYTAGVDDKVVMPPAGEPLTPAQVGVLRAWIDQGAPWPDESTAEAEAPSRRRSDHWAFQPVMQPQPPAVRDDHWIRNDVDRFVLAKLEAKSLRPSPEASKPTLMRRLSLDLTGLPPTPREIDEFLLDNRPEAYEALVDSLMQSQHYGERWARYWLDLARYADSDGYRGDAFRPNAWRYRHWVIDAINRDLPFDEFTVEQIAGDLLPEPSIEQIVATGFHRNTLTNREGGTDPEEFRVEQVVDRTSTVGTVWLGLTVGCARCHDHKYDPISQREFFSLYAFFNDADEVDIDAPLPGERGPYLAARPDYLRDREELLESYGVPEHKPQWEKRMLEVAASPGEWPDWDISFDDLRTYLDHGERILRTPPAERTWKEEKGFTDYFVNNYKRVLTKERADELKWHELSRELRKLDEAFPALSEAPVVEKSREDRRTRIHVRGQYTDEGISVEPGVPDVLPPLDEKKSSRLDLARWLTAKENPLTARVTVNRFWQELFGAGIVITSDNFGMQGETPSHPQLLDWLAAEFMREGWSMKRLVKTIVMSSTYRQSSDARDDLETIDPANRLLARQSRLRLSAEQIRDSALVASGLLYPKVGGRSVRPPQPEGAQRLGGSEWSASEGKDRYRRGLYIVFQRMSPYPLMTNFDMPSAYGPACRRNRSNTPLQALNLLNDPAFTEAAQALSARILTEPASSDESDRLDYAFELCLGRRPASDEQDYLIRELSRLRSIIDKNPDAIAELVPIEIPGGGRDEQAAWTMMSSVLLNLDEFITRE